MNPMKRVTHIAAIAAVLASMPVAVAVASGGPSGTYTTTITKPAILKGTYRLTFTRGHLILELPGGKVRRGTDTILGSTIRFRLRGGLCRRPGTYKFTLSASSVTFTKVKDPCSRSVVFTAYPWTRA
jgi:hypothetical protein